MFWSTLLVQIFFLRDFIKVVQLVSIIVAKFRGVEECHSLWESSSCGSVGYITDHRACCQHHPSCPTTTATYTTTSTAWRTMLINSQWHSSLLTTGAPWSWQLLPWQPKNYQVPMLPKSWLPKLEQPELWLLKTRIRKNFNQNRIDQNLDNPNSSAISWLPKPWWPKPWLPYPWQYVL